MCFGAKKANNNLFFFVIFDYFLVFRGKFSEFGTIFSDDFMLEY